MFRPLRPDDTEAVHRLIRSCEQHDRSPIVTPLEEVTQMFEEPYFDPGHDGWIAEADGEPMAWGRIFHTPSSARQERAFLLGDVHPEHRGRGLGRQLIALQMERASSLLSAADHDLPRFIRAQAYEWRDDARRLYRAAGMEPVRYHDELIRPLDELPVRPDRDGFEVVGWGDEHVEPARLVVNEAFADHWGSTPKTPEAWASMLDEYGMRLDRSFVAVDPDGAVVGATVNFHVPEDEEVTGRTDGWIGMLGVVRPWRRRGVASALIVESLLAFADAGFTHACLGVDSENPTGAYSLYGSHGFERMHRAVTYQVQV
jgi:mycothiol synthase